MSLTIRQAAKEQREQESRQHEQQTQYLQAEARRLNDAVGAKLHEVKTAYQDNVRLTSELASTRAELNRAQEEGRAIKPLQARLALLERTVEGTQRELTQSQIEVQQLRSLNSNLETTTAELQQQNLDLCRARDIANSAAQAQEQIVSTILAQISSANGQKSKSRKAAVVNESIARPKTDGQG
ncbi:hypothetical protein [Aquabacterium sp.]|uniref:hypothetical protein n=1 Tax=Aquabacterium sp. TaxID=1872578 RepID=UPI0019C2F4CF|nr:hypothetical protein [Aquabacterium sp.]MBC7702034.1 hypothetical protein [Aquabacterium sp.]